MCNLKCTNENNTNKKEEKLILPQNNIKYIHVCIRKFNNIYN